ncbi:MAG: PAS domain-containing protein, partial [Patescibacteria group bacterium]|nr:PAS domain-containing protein [Patescibacteria group bacterium]
MSNRTAGQSLLIKDLNRAQAVALIGSWRLDTKNNILRWSDQTYRMFGIPIGTAMTYETFLSKVHPQDRSYVNKKWNEALRGNHYDIEHRIIVGKKILWVREKAELEFNTKKELVGGFGTVQDITKEKRKDEEIERLSRFPLENPSPIIRIDKNGR